MHFREATFAGVRFLQLERWIEQGLQHGFGGVDLDLRTEQGAWERCFPGSELLTMQQVHGTRVVCAADLRAGSERPEADGIVFQVSGAARAAAVATADCAPLILWEPKKGLAAVVHCGWRSTVGGIVYRAMEALCERGAEAGRVEAAIGPCARAASYEVQQDVAEIFECSALETGQAGAAAHCIRRQGGRIFADNPALIRAQLGSLGIGENRIFDAGICTIEDPNYFSFRRQKASSGRQVSFVIGA